MTFDGQGCYLLDGNDKSAFNAYIANERRTLEVSRLRRSAPVAQPRREERTSAAVAGSVVEREQVTTRTRRVAGRLARR
jgi:hypothetical protein